LDVVVGFAAERSRWTWAEPFCLRLLFALSVCWHCHSGDDDD